jgi:hypothetical protein
MAQLQAKSYPPEFSTDGSTYKTLVCTSDWTLTGSATVTKDDTFCGVFSTPGTPSFQVSANAVAETAPSSTQVSYEDVLSWFANNTLIYFRVQDPKVTSAGTNFYTQFSCYITGVTQTFASADVIKFSLTAESTGTIDVTP